MSALLDLSHRGATNQSLGIEVPATNSLGDSHENVCVQPQPCDPYTGISLILGREVGIVMVMMVSMGMTTMGTLLLCERQFCGCVE